MTKILLMLLAAAPQRLGRQQQPRGSGGSTTPVARAAAQAAAPAAAVESLIYALPSASFRTRAHFLYTSQVMTTSETFLSRMSLMFNEF